MASNLNHHSSYRVYFEDTDAGGVVYHANYLKFAERARGEWLRSLGYEQSILKEQKGILFVVKHQSIDFIASAKLDDLLLVETRLVALRHASVRFHQEIFCHQKKITQTEVILACVDLKSKPVRIPKELVEKFKQLLSL